MRAIDRIIFHEYRSDAGLGIYRVLFAGFVLLASTSYAWIGEFGDAFFYPPIGPALLFSGFPPTWFFLLLHFLILLAGLCLLTGRHVRTASVALGLLLVVGNSWKYSFGKIDHDIFIVIVPLLMAFRWDLSAASRPEGAPTRTGWPLALLAMLIGMAMVTAVVPKVLGGWLEPDARATLSHVIRNHYVTERETILSGVLVRIGSAPFWKFVDYSTLLVESSFIVMMFSHRLFRLCCAVACFFHFGVWLSMDIVFSANLIAYGAFVNWAVLLQSQAVRRGVTRFESWTHRIPFWGLAAAAAAICGWYTWAGNPWARAVHVLLLWSAVVIATSYLVYLGRDFYVRFGGRQQHVDPSVAHV